jgi:hypothetical protein
MRRYLRTKVRRHIVNGLGVTKRVLQGNELSESFYMIPSDTEPSRSALKKENGSLKQELEAMSKRLAAAERIMQLRKEQDQQLRESIVMARHQVILRLLRRFFYQTDSLPILSIRHSEQWVPQR